LISLKCIYNPVLGVEENISKIMIRPETILQRKSDLLFNIIDREVIMLSIENSEYYGLDRIGSRIWELLSRPISFKSLIDKIMDEYEVSETQCKSDTLTFINTLIDKKLLT
jgi:hypothetical protein